MVVEPGIGDLGERGLGAIGDAKPRRLDHRAVIGAVADRDDRVRRDAERVARVDQGARLERRIDDPAGHRPGETPIGRFEHIGLDPLEPDHRRRPVRQRR